MVAGVDRVSLPYHEPGIVSILTLTSFLLILNVINHVVDRVLYVGLLGQIFIGIAWGVPGGNWLGPATENVCVNLGYLGLLLLVYEGGLTTSFQSLKANLSLSLSVAATGVALPIALSYMLMVLASATPLQAFAAGAALCSTSLGTTFTVMQTSGLITTRLGVVLTSAAMIDDVAGLVMVQVISNLGVGSSSFKAVTVVRPIFVSLAFGITVPIVCRFLVLPLTMWLNQWRVKAAKSALAKLLITKETAFISHTILLVSTVTGATYAGTSSLFAAYLTGAAVSWWDSEVPHRTPSVRRSPRTTDQGGISTNPRSSDASVPSIDTNVRHTNISNSPNAPTERRPHAKHFLTSGVGIFERYYQQPLQRILKPFFFASIGFSIPITHIFAGSVVWRGLVYTMLVILGKMACGLWLVRISWPAWLGGLFSGGNASETRTKKEMKAKTEPETKTATSSPTPTDVGDHQTHEKACTNPEPGASSSSSPRSHPATTTTSGQQQQRQHPPNSSAKLVPTHSTPPLPRPTPQSPQSHSSSHPPNPISLYPATILGCAMVSRGEIGFLISSVAESTGIFGENPDIRGQADVGENGNGHLFLIVTWAIMLCTIVGPVCVGAMVRRLRQLERMEGEGGGDMSGDGERSIGGDGGGEGPRSGGLGGGGGSGSGRPGRKNVLGVWGVS